MVVRLAMKRHKHSFIIRAVKVEHTEHLVIRANSKVSIAVLPDVATVIVADLEPDLVLVSAFGFPGQGGGDAIRIGLDAKLDEWTVENGDGEGEDKKTAMNTEGLLFLSFYLSLNVLATT